jgi:hypothetical protein
MANANIINMPTLAVGTDLTDFVFDRSITENSSARAMTTQQVIAAYSSPKLQERWSDRKTKWSAANESGWPHKLAGSTPLLQPASWMNTGVLIRPLSVITMSLLCLQGANLVLNTQ